MFDHGGHQTGTRWISYTIKRMTTDLLYISDVCNSVVATLQDLERICREMMLQEEHVVKFIKEDVEDTEDTEDEIII